MNSKRIGVSGKRGSGKSTVASFLKEYEFEEICFADALKKEVSQVYGVDLASLYTIQGKERMIEGQNMTAGQMLQTHGAFRRKLDENVWARSVLNEIGCRPDRSWVVSDVRYKNEARMLAANGFVLIRIEGDPTNLRQSDSRDSQHCSEIDLDDYTDFDHVIVNDGTVEDLRRKVLSVLEE